MVKVLHQFTFEKQKLASMPKEERTLLLLLGHAMNEITVLTKLTSLSGNAIATIDFVDYIQAYQTLILYRLLVGKLHETWKLFRTNFMNKEKMAKKYRAMFKADVNKSIDFLKREFDGGDSLLTKVRDSAAFHAPTAKEIEASFQTLPDSERWHTYMSAEAGQSFYFASELVVMDGILKKVPLPSYDEKSRSRDDVAFSEFCRVTGAVAQHMATVIDHCIAEIGSPYFAADLPVELEVPEAAIFRGGSLPFFIER